MSKATKNKILKLWKEGKNVWEISQIVGVSESAVMEVVR